VRKGSRPLRNTLNQTSAALRVAALSMALSLTAPLYAGAQEASGPIRIGVVTFLSGPASSAFGVAAGNGAELIVDAINAGDLPPPYVTPGMAGLAIDMVMIDEAGGVTKQVSELRNLAQRQEVEAVVGYQSSGSCLGIAPAAEELRLLTVFSTCGTPRIFEEGDYRYVFRTSALATMDGIGAARYVADRYGDTEAYAGLNQNFAWGQDSWRDFRLAMDTLMPEAELVTEQFPRLFAGVYGSEISALQIAGPEIVHSSFFGGDLEAFLLQALARGLIEDMTFVLTAGEPAMYSMGGDMPDGVVIGGRGPYGLFARDTELNRWFRDRYRARFAAMPPYPAYHMAQAFLGLKLAYDRAAEGGERPDTERVIDAFEGLEYQSFGTSVRMTRANGHQAVTETAYGTYRYDHDAGEPTVENVIRYAPDCVNPPPGTDAIPWIEQGMPGAACE